MKIIKSLLGFLGAVLVAALGLFGVSTPVLAEEIPEYRLQISPVRLELELKPGVTTTTTFKVQNTGTKEFDFSIETSPYSVNDEEYDGNFTDKTEYNNIVDWVTYSMDRGTAQPGDSIEVTATINVPNDVPTGGQYAMIAVTMDKNGQEGEDSGAMITATSRAGILLYSEIEGNTRKEGSIIENKVPGFMFNPPISVTSVVENTGNVHAKATYVLQVYPFFGSEEVYTNEENPETRIILPGTRRLNTMTWEDAPHLGLFKVKQTIKFLDKESVTEKVLFICPIWFLLIILVLIFLIIFWIVSRVRGGRKEA